MFELNNIRSLKTKFKGRGEMKGFSFRQLGVMDRAYLYEVRKGLHIHYEVFIKRINKRNLCLTYPTRKSFGESAWKYEIFCDAVKKYNQLIYDENGIN